MARVCFVCQRLASALDEGPHQRAVRWLIPEFVARGIEVDLVCTSVASPGAKAWAGSSPARVFLLDTPRVHRAIPALRRYLQTERPDVCVGLVAGLSLLTFLSRTGVRPRPSVVPWEATPLMYDLPSLTRRERIAFPPLIRRCYPRAGAILGVSHDCIATLGDLGVPLNGVTRAVVPYPANLEELTRWSQEDPPLLPGRDWKHMIVASGRLAFHKGHDVLLRAVADLRSQDVDVGLVILGDGPLRADLESLIERLKLTDRVLLPGHVRPPQPLYRAATMFVHPSRWEGFGMSLVEAMATGTPVVATSCPGGPKEIIDGGRCGALVAPDDAHALAEAIGTLLGDEAQRAEMGERARSRVAEYAPGKVARQLVEAIALT